MMPLPNQAESAELVRQNWVCTAFNQQQLRHLVVERNTSGCQIRKRLDSGLTHRLPTHMYTPLVLNSSKK